MKFTRLSTWARALVVLGTLGCAAFAHAVPITYVFSGLASGNVTPTGGDANAFTREKLTVTISTDTTNIDNTQFGANIPATHNLVNGLISVNGVGSGSFLNALYVFNNHSTEIVGFGDLAHNDLINLKNTNAGLDTYDMKSTMAVINGTPPNFVAQFVGVGLSFGLMSLNSIADLTFEATTGQVNDVPEPQSLALVAAALVLLSVTTARRRNG